MFSEHTDFERTEQGRLQLARSRAFLDRQPLARSTTYEAIIVSCEQLRRSLGVLQSAAIERPFHPDAPCLDCRTDHGRLYSVSYGHVIQTRRFRCDECARTWSRRRADPDWEFRFQISLD